MDEPLVSIRSKSPTERPIKNAVRRTPLARGSTATPPDDAAVGLQPRVRRDRGTLPSRRQPAAARAPTAPRVAAAASTFNGSAAARRWYLACRLRRSRDRPATDFGTQVAIDGVVLSVAMECWAL